MWLRWSARDLRHNAVAVAAIALVMAIGIGVFAGLGSTATWRRESNDASFAALRMHDLRVALSPGTFADEGALAATVGLIEDAGSVAAVSERLIVDSQVDTTTATASDATNDGEAILVRARLVGMEFEGDSTVDDLWLRDGEVPDVAAPGDPTVALEAKFADDNELATTGVLAIAGGRQVTYVGLGATPEDFFYGGPEGTVLSQGDFAILYAPLPTAQDLSGEVGRVNDVVLTLADGADPAAIASQLAAAMEAAGFGATVSTRDEAVAFRVLYEDIENDQRVWNAVSALVLMAAALAAFNLVSRIVEAQRREIGIGMALGVPRWQLAIRPLLVGVEVALLGSLAGLAVGSWVGGAMADLLESLLPLPDYRTPFQFGVFARAAVLGMVIPIAASALPVWRAVRVEPIEAIRTGHLAAKSSGMSDWTNRFTLPGSSLTQMAVRNVFRTPRRSILTALGVGAAITALVGVLGLLDSFSRTIDQGSAELTRGDSDRVIVQLDTFYDAASPALATIESAPAVGITDEGLRLPATAVTPDPDDEFDLVIELIDLDVATWVPTTEESSSGEPDGLILAQKAADDLGVGGGDRITVRHPYRADDGAFSITESTMTVAAIHPNPLRAFAYADLGMADDFGLEGTTNVLNAYPVVGSTSADLQRAVFNLPGVTSSQAVAGISEGFDKALEQFIGFLFIAAVAVLILALLIAFNASRITIDERRREHATMRAFGLPVRSVMGVVVKESIVVGLLATAIGVAAGLAFLSWMLQSLATTTVPELGIDAYLSPSTIIIAIAVGLVAVAAAPLFLVRRVRKMNIPDTLRVME